MKSDFQDIPVEQLKLDDRNPRLPKSIQGKKTEEEELINYLLLEEATLELMLAIGENGFFRGEQLLVVKDTDGKYRVIEGNRRLAAVKLLGNPKLAKYQKNKVNKVIDELRNPPPTEIPCLIFPNEDDILKYLGYRHITGIKSWKLLEKARYLYELKSQVTQGTSFYETCRELAKMIGSRRDYVQRLLVGFEIYKIIEDNAFYKIKGLDDTTFHFNYIADSLNRSKISAYLGVDLEKESPIANLKIPHVKKWTHWLFEKNSQNKTRLIGDSRHLNMLDKVIAVPKAFKAFDESGLKISKAYELTEDINNVFSSFVGKSLSYLEEANSVLHLVDSITTSDMETLKNIGKLAKQIIIIKETTIDEF